MIDRRREICSWCERPAKVQLRVDGQAVCVSCEKAWLGEKARCSRCGRHRRPALGRANAGLCEQCAGIVSTQICQRCGAEEKLYAAGRCTNCYLEDEITRMRAAGDPVAVDQLASYLDALSAARPANSVLHWLRASRTSAAPLLREMVAGTRPITHQALDELPDNHAIAFLRAALVKHRALPDRDEVLHRFEQWIETVAATLPDHPDQASLRRWAIWVVLHDLRVRRRHATKPTSDRYARDIVRATAKFIRWIHAQELTLAKIRQEHLDRWLAEPNNTRRLVRPFLTWTSKGGITTPLAVYRGPEPRTGASLTSDNRIQLIRRLLADETLALRTRIAGLLILLYGQPLARIVRTRTDQIHRERSQVSLLLGRDKLLLPEPIDHLILRYLAELHANTLHDQPATPWLFPGMIAGAPITAERLRRRLVRDLDHLPIRPSRNSAVANLLRDVPAPVLADLLGFSQDRAHLWAQLAATDLASYVAARQDIPRPG